ncbi:MAG: response regulator transcription factor [Anaerolineae bacterium]|nr:response regulator transcription factor [Anaerolineae bacterium]
MIKVVVVDDHDVVRGAVSALLDANDEMEVIGEATNGKEAIAVVEELMPDVVVMDISMPGMDGITATEKITASNGRHTRVVMLSMYASSDLVEQALKNGATGYLLKRSTPAELVKGVVAASQGKRFLSAGISPHI